MRKGLEAGAGGDSTEEVEEGKGEADMEVAAVEEGDMVRDLSTAVKAAEGMVEAADAGASEAGPTKRYLP